MTSSRVEGPFQIGQIIAGSYEITGVLGLGGMGVVYDAVDQALRRRVAIKVARFPVYEDALVAEARALAALRSPSFVSVFGLTAHEGVQLVVMERLHGETLEARIEHHRGQGEVPPVIEVVEVLAQIADALSVAHTAGISQRDLKPSNVMVCGGRVVLLDLGIAVPEALVQPGATGAGTVQYIAPEVVLGEVERGLGPMIDLYALGILAYELLTNHAPFQTDSARQVLMAHLRAPRPDVRTVRPDVPDQLAALIQELMAKSPHDRPPSAEAVLWQLEQIGRRAGRQSARGITVLAVDDELHVARALKCSLESAFPRMSVQTLTDPGIAMSDRGDDPDVVLVDLNMPGHNGVEVCMHLLSLPPSRRPTVVAMSAEARSEDIALLRTLGVRDFVPKDDAFVASMSAIVSRLRSDAHHPAQA